MNKITKAEHPECFVDVLEFEVDRKDRHRRGSSFYRDVVIEFTQDNVEEFNLPEWAVGYWQVNTFTWDDNYGVQWEEIDTLTRVDLKEETQIVKYWNPVY